MHKDLETTSPQLIVAELCDLLGLAETNSEELLVYLQSLEPSELVDMLLPGRSGAYRLREISKFYNQLYDEAAAHVPELRRGPLARGGRREMCPEFSGLEAVAESKEGGCASFILLAQVCSRMPALALEDDYI